MKNLLSAGRVLALDLASTILFLIIYLATDSLFLGVGLGMALGVAQIAWQHARKQPIGTIQLLSVILILASGTATFISHDPRFVMVKPSIIYTIVGVVMLKRGWMNRYLPPEAVPVLDIGTLFGYVWAGLMFASAALNIALAFSLDAKVWAAAMSAWGLSSKIGLFLIQYATMNFIGRRRVKAAQANPADTKDGEVPAAT